MVKIIWTERSLSDLETIAEYIAKDSFKYAQINHSKNHKKNANTPKPSPDRKKSS